MEQITNKLNRIKTAKENIKTSLENKGLTVDDNIETYASKISEIPVIDFEINNCRYLFYGDRGNLMEYLLPLCKNVTDVTYMFWYCTKPYLEFKNFDLSKATKGDYMFSNATSQEIDISGLDTSSFTSTQYMFDYTKCKKINISNVDFSNVTDTTRMFNESKLEELISNGVVDFSKVTSASRMFSGTSNLVTLPTLDFGGINSSISNMFYYNIKLENFGGLKDLGKSYKTTNAENYGNYQLVLTDCNSLTHESLMNVINNLYDIASIGCKPQLLKLGATNLAKLEATEEGQQAIILAQTKGWNVTA